MMVIYREVLTLKSSSYKLLELMKIQTFFAAQELTWFIGLSRKMMVEVMAHFARFGNRHCDQTVLNFEAIV